MCFVDLIGFREEFREQYKKEHPKNKSVAAVSMSNYFLFFGDRISHFLFASNKLFVNSSVFFCFKIIRLAKRVVINGSRCLKL